MDSFSRIFKTKLFASGIITKVWIFVVLGVLLFKGVLIGWNSSSGDFNNYYVSAELVSNGGLIHQFYDNDWFNQQAKDIGVKEGAKFSPFPPITAYVYLPLTFFEPLTAKRVWLVFNILILVVFPFRIRKITGWSLDNAMLFLSLFIIPIISCIHLGQLYLLIGFLLFELFSRLPKINKSYIFGFLIGAVTALKYLPIIFLAYILKHKKRNSILIWAFLGVAIPSLTVFFIDSNIYDAFFQHFISHLQGNLPGQGKYAVAFQSIDSLLNNLFVYDSLKNPFPYLNLPILKPVFKFFLWSVIIGLVLLSLKKNRYQATPIMVSIAIIGVFVLIPASASYHFLLLLWPVFCIIKWLLTFKSRRALILISVLFFFSFSIRQSHIPNFDQFPTINLLLHYPRFWGLLCVFLFLSYYHIKLLKKNYG